MDCQISLFWFIAVRLSVVFWKVKIEISGVLAGDLKDNFLDSQSSIPNFNCLKLLGADYFSKKKTQFSTIQVLDILFFVVSEFKTQRDSGFV